MFLAQLMASVLQNGGGELQSGQVSKPTVSDTVGDVSEVDTQQEQCDTQQEQCADSQKEDLVMEQVEYSFPPTPPHLGERAFSSQKNARQPIWVEWTGRETEFVDGFGLCSPNLCRPEQRGAFLGK